MKNIFDTHAHYLDAAFDGDRNELLGSVFESGVSAIVECATDLESSKKVLALAERYDNIYAACGIHPEDIHKINGEWESALTAFLKHPKCVAVGEIGLDYHWRDNDKALQKDFFEKQLIIANTSGLPVIIHDREAHGDTLELLKKHKPKGVLHCYSGSVETALEAVALGLYIGFGGALTFKNARKTPEVLSAIPRERILFETDCPYMAPVPHRSERNDSRLIEFVALKAAEILSCDAQTLTDKAAENARCLFGI